MSTLNRVVNPWTWARPWRARLWYMSLRQVAGVRVAQVLVAQHVARIGEHPGDLAELLEHVLLDARGEAPRLELGEVALVGPIDLVGGCALGDAEDLEVVALADLLDLVEDAVLVDAVGGE